MSPRFVLGRENVPCVAEVVNRSLKDDCTDFSLFWDTRYGIYGNIFFFAVIVLLSNFLKHFLVSRHHMTKAGV